MVNTLADTTDSAGSATVSLRDAINDANGAVGANETSTITFRSSLTGKISARRSPPNDYQNCLHPRPWRISGRN